MQFIGFTLHKVLQTLYISLLILAFLNMDFYCDTPLAEKIRSVVFCSFPYILLKKMDRKRSLFLLLWHALYVLLCAKCSLTQLNSFLRQQSMYPIHFSIARRPFHTDVVCDSKVIGDNKLVNKVKANVREVDTT